MAEAVEIKTVPAVRVAELSAPVGGFEPQFITPVLGPLFEQLMGGWSEPRSRAWAHRSPTTRTRGR